MLAYHGCNILLYLRTACYSDFQWKKQKASFSKSSNSSISSKSNKNNKISVEDFKSCGTKPGASSKMSFVASIFQVFWPQNQNSYYTKAPVDDWFGVVHFKYFLYQKRINIKITYIKNHNNYLTYFPFSLFPFSVFFFLPFLKSLDPISCDSIP